MVWTDGGFDEGITALRFSISQEPPKQQKSVKSYMLKGAKTLRSYIEKIRKYVKSVLKNRNSENRYFLSSHCEMLVIINNKK